MPVVGQSDTDTDTETVQLTGAYDITIPDDWDIYQDTVTGYFWTDGDTIYRVRTYTPRFLRDFEGIDADATPEEFLEWLVIDVFENRSLEEDSLEAAQFGDDEGLLYRMERLDQGEAVPYEIGLYKDDNGLIILGYAYPDDGTTLDTSARQQLVNVLNSANLREMYVYYDDTSFDLMQTDWQILEEIATGIPSFYIRNDDVALFITYWPRYAAIAGFENPRDFLAFVWDGEFPDSGRYDRTLAEETQIAGFDGISYTLDETVLNSDDLYRREIFVFELSQNNSYVMALVLTEDTDTDYDRVYDTLDTFSAGNRIVCPLFADPGISIRAEPTTRSERVGQTGDETFIALYDTTGDDGFRWFKVSEGWIRSDVIFFERNTCEGLPTR